MLNKFYSLKNWQLSVKHIQCQDDVIPIYSVKARELLSSSDLCLLPFLLQDYPTKLSIYLLFQHCKMTHDEPHRRQCHVYAIDSQFISPTASCGSHTKRTFQLYVIFLTGKIKAYYIQFLWKHRK